MRKRILLLLEILYNVIAIIFLVLASIFIISEMIKNTPERVFIQRKAIMQTLDKGEALLIDYFMDGIGTNATFYKHEEQSYNDFMKYLESFND